jgi:glutamate 5-kinase
MKSRLELLGNARRVAVKLGTGLLTDHQNRLALDRMRRLVAQLAGLCREGRQLIVISSGAIAAGMETLGLPKRPKQLPQLQAAAAIGQSRLMALYDEAFAPHKVTVAQVLLTHDDLRNRVRHLNARNTLAALLANGIVPIINENDTVSVDEIRFGDNDLLAALTATLIDAELLVILSHVPGLLRGDQPLSVVPEITREIEKLAGGTDRLTSVGGMKSKIEAARIVTRAGIPMVIAGGEQPDVLASLLDGQDIGTLFLPRTPRLPGRKRWIAFFQRPAAALVVDEGARRALCQNGKSLLARGVVRAEGAFARGDLLSLRDENKIEFARGLAKVASNQFNAAPGVVVHRDDLVIL